jgi:hypothetical protein
MYFIACILMCFILDAYCGGEAIREKYSNVLISDDHGILDERDLLLYTHRMVNTVPFLGSNKEFSYYYWQCFSRDDIEVTFKDTGYSPEEMLGKDTLADMSIIALQGPGVFHEYTMRALMPSDVYARTLSTWRKLIKNEKYVCIGGQFGEKKDRIGSNGKRQELYTWTFDMIKTHKGCDSYFGDCPALIAGA